jgi:malonate decarboxylase beta subunit
MIRPITDSYAERCARERARALLDPHTFREILGPFERVGSPYLAVQDIAPQSDDGVVLARGTVGGVSACVAATEGRFLGGAIGEVGGTKIAAALECALRDAERGAPTRVVLALDTGGIRLQEANLGILAIAEICDAIVALQAYVPVVAVIAGRVGVYGGMSIAASLCDSVIVTEGARIGLNGPDVIETEAGIEEIDAADRPLIWRLTGGRRRFEQGFASDFVADDVSEIRAAVDRAFGTPRRGAPLRAPDFPYPGADRSFFLTEFGIEP